VRIPTGSTDRYLYFVAVDATDLKTRETGLSSFTVYGSRNGAAAAAFTTPTINETDSANMPGVYELLLDEQTTLTAGHDNEELCLHITHSGMAPVTRAVELYRPKGGEGDAFVDADVTAISGDATAADNLEADYDGTGYAKANSTIGTCTTNTDLVTAAAVRAEIDSNSTQLAAIVADTNELQTDWANGGRLDLILDELTTQGDTNKTTLDAIEADTQDLQTQIGTAGAGLSAVPWNAAWDAEVQSEANDALVALGLDHLVSASVSGSDVTDNSIIARLVSKSATADWDSYSNETDSLEALRDRGDIAWATADATSLAALSGEQEIFLGGEDSETVEYQPRDGSAARTIYAMVEREGYQTDPDSGYGSGPVLKVWVANSDTVGISRDELDTGGDKLNVAVEVGGSMTARPIRRVIEEDPCMLYLELG